MSNCLIKSVFTLKSGSGLLFAVVKPTSFISTGITIGGIGKSRPKKFTAFL